MDNTEAMSAGAEAHREVEARLKADAPKPLAEAGTEVKHGDVMPFARRSCKACFGRGELLVHRPSYRPGHDGTPQPLPMVRGHEVKAAKICGCALRRFLKENGSKVCVRPDSALCWKVP